MIRLSRRLFGKRYRGGTARTCRTCVTAYSRWYEKNRRRRG